LSILETWGISEKYLTEVVDSNPSLRGMMVGYISERKLRDLFASNPDVRDLRKEDDHDRTQKSDLVVGYRGFEFTIEVKSLQTNLVEVIDGRGRLLKKMVKERAGLTAKGHPRYRFVPNPEVGALSSTERLEARYEGKVQCDASDRRTITVPGGRTVTTTCLKVGDFDILAAGLFAFREQWDFGFALNRDLPRSTYAKYPPEVQAQLLKSLVPVSWPLRPPFVSDPFILLDRLIEERRRC